MSTLSNYEALLALSSSPALTPEMREYLVKVLEEHREMRMALEFYADADTWFAVILFSDPPCGPIVDDIDEADDGEMRPGKCARAILAKVNT